MGLGLYEHSGVTHQQSEYIRAVVAGPSNLSIHAERPVKAPATLADFLFDGADVQDAFEARDLGAILADLHDEGATIADLERVAKRYRVWEGHTIRQRGRIDEWVI